MLKVQFLLVFLLSFLGTLPAGAESPPPPSASTKENIAEPAPSANLTTFEEATPISYEGAFAKMLLTLAGLIILIFLTVWILRKVSQGRFGGASSNGRNIRILERRALSPKSVLYLIEIGNQKILISESQLEVRRITAIEPRSTELE